jgi:putative ABC transport system permease protein
MIRNHFKIAWRTLAKNRVHLLINITGLAVGLTCSLLIFLWVQSELDVDAYHANKNLLFKVYEREFVDHKLDGDYDTPALMGEELKKQLPGVQYAINMQEVNESHAFEVGDKIIKLEGTYAGADVFRMFSYPLIKGQPENALSSPASIAISGRMAGIFFGSAAAAMGKTVRFDNKQDFTVTAVFKDLPDNSSRKFEYLVNWDAFLKAFPGAKRWDNSGPLTYVMLRPDASRASVEKKLTHFLDRYNPPSPNFRIEYGLQRFDEVYLHSHFENGRIEGGRILYVNLFTIVALFVLLIACINFMNLTTAQSVNRAREIGVRKVMGANRAVLISQFLSESMLITTAAVLLSLFLVTAVLPLFNQLTTKQLIMPFNQAVFWISILVVTFATGLLSGIYPAFFLSSFNPVGVLKGKLNLDGGAVWFRKGLVVFQFAISTILIVATVIVSKQVAYIQKANLGYDRENLVYVPIEGSLPAQFNTFKTQALNMPGILSVSAISTSPTSINDGTTSVTWDGKTPGSTVSFAIADVGYDFASTVKLKMVDGRDFSKAYPSDKDSYLINQPAAEKFGYVSPVGRTINMWGNKGKIIGVVKDFHFASLHDQVQPLILRLSDAGLANGYLLVRTKPGQTKEALTSLASLCKALNPGFPFTYSFSNQEYQKLYEIELVAGKLANIFALLAAFISCLGLLGLAVFTVEQRVKEIGIRKVLGASIASIFTTLSSQFIWLISIALLIACPAAWYLMDKWLSGFAYHTTMPLWVFMFSGGLILIIALATVGFQAIKAALINPVKSLKAE